MKESIGYSVSLNLIIIFIVIIFAVLAMSLSYYRAFKVSNRITSSIEKYEGYNKLSETEIIEKLTNLGYNQSPISCSQKKDNCDLVPQGEYETSFSTGQKGYCVYFCVDNANSKKQKGAERYHYKIVTNLIWKFPIVDRLLNIPVETNTKPTYNWEVSK